MKLSPKDLQAATTQINSSAISLDQKYMTAARPLSQYFDINGVEHTSLDAEDTYARVVQSINGPKYQIVTNQNNEVFVKDDAFYLTASERLAKLYVKEPYKFVTVEKSILLDYVNYLKTGSLLALRKAQNGV